MFIDKQSPLLGGEPRPEIVPSKSLLGRKEMILIAIIAGIILVAIGAWWYYAKILHAPKPVETPIVQEPVVPILPGSLPGDQTNTGNNGTPDNPDLKGENVTFGNFYKPLNDPLTVKAPAIALPLNVKSQVSNYYDTARKINLDPVISNLNQDGFATLENVFPKSANDFFGNYYELNKRSVPVLVTSDFLLYYYQNSLKQIYKQVESSFFYDSMWKITKAMYDNANARYQERRQKLGVASDSLLEAERLETAYFAAGLVLLDPAPEQINSTEDLNDSTKFKPSEAKGFEFSPPSYLTDDLAREIDLIKEAKQTVKSPVLLYQRNYTDFKIPDEYTTSAKLHNFYLASRWYTSLFPLYYKDKSCPSCLLDKEDWIINQTAAHLIGNDLSTNQSLKNEWAKIYKVISFFSGLRSELTYLHYDQARQALFPKTSLEDIFGTKSFDRLVTLRDRLANLDFKAAEGAYSRTKASDKPILGMRLLQTFYWPSQSFYDQLTFDAVGSHNHPFVKPDQKASYFTACDDHNNLIRCRGLGYDVINPILLRRPGSKFLLDNTDYNKYGLQLEAIRQQLSSFNAVSWHNNNFWTTLNTVGAFVNERLTTLPYDGQEHWLEQKLSSALATMTSMTLPADSWQTARNQQSGGLEVSGTSTSLNYIEPNARLSDELVANTQMLFNALISLGVVKDNDISFTDLLTKMTTSRNLIRKELSGQTLATEDYQFMSDFISQFKIGVTGAKNLEVDFTNPKTNQTITVKQSVSDLKLLFLIYEKDGKKILAAGPVFSYKEQ